MFSYQVSVLLLLKVFFVFTGNVVGSGRGMSNGRHSEVISDVALTETMTSILQEYTEELSAMRNELQSVRTENTDMKNVIAELQESMKYLKQRDTDQNDLLEQNSREINLLKSRYEVIQTGSAIKAGRSKSRGLKERFILMDTDNTDYAESKDDKSRQKLAGSEFYARLGQKLEVLEHEQTIIYDITVTNGGLTYNNKSGIFTCITSGVYVFSWSTLVTADNYVETILRSNTTDLGLTYSGGKDYPGSGSQTVVANLHQGENVQVKVGSFTPGSVLYDIYTTFSGFRLQ